MTHERPAAHLDRSITSGAEGRSLADTLASVRSHLPSSLVSDDVYAAVSRVSGRLPAALTRRLYVECRLHDVAAVDLVFCIDESGRAMLQKTRPAWLPAALHGNPLWTGVARLCSRWADPTSPLHKLIYDVWLEFDAGERSHGVEALVPNVFVGFTASRGVGRSVLWAAATEALTLLSGGPVSRAADRAVTTCLESLPREANLAYVGYMFPRESSSIRICVTPLGGSALSTYLERVKWAGSVKDVENALRRLTGRGPIPTTTLLHLDIRQGVLPRIGIELPLDQRTQLRGQVAERALLDRLCDSGLCTAAKRDALLRWPGHERVHVPQQDAPRLMLRRVSHVKLVAEAGRPPVAKAYLSLFHATSSGYA